MKIAVCFKALVDYTRLSPNDWKWDDNYFVDTSFVPRIFNCFEESALEMALKLSKKPVDGSEILELTAITVDGQQGDLFLKHLMAVGYDHGIRIQCEKKPDLRFNSLAVSRLISSYITQQGQNLAILGMQGGEGDNGQTGFFVAENLAWPCINRVTRFEMDQGPDSLKVTSRIDGADLVQTVKLPLVLIIGHSLDSPYLRVPSLKQKLNAKKKKATILSDIELKVDTDINKDKILTDLQQHGAGRACIFIKGKNAKEQAQILYDQFLKKRLSL
jgi:electron transfer flavoprotein beta subunit